MMQSLRLLMLCLVLLSPVIGCSSDGDGGDDGDGDVLEPKEEVVGSGNLVVEPRAVAGFSAVLHSTEGSLEIVHGAAESLVVRAEDNLLPYLESVVSGTLLELRTKGNVELVPTRPIEFELTVIDVEEIELAGVGSIDWSGIDRAGTSVFLSGVGDITMSGTVTDQAVSLSGVGDYMADQLTSTNADVSLCGTGDVTVWVSDVLDATICGTGSVYYYGAPTTVNKTITGTGVVEPGP